MCDRIISFASIPNARDLGGLTTTRGQRIRRGLLLRSASLCGAAEQDIRALENHYHLKKIIDLRTGMERQEKPDAAVPGAEYCPIPVFDVRMAGISHENRDFQLSDIPPMEALYRNMVADPDCRKNLGRAAVAVMEQNFSSGAVLWHCTEGKDRCGLLAAVLLLALEVDQQTILQDYLLTNVVNGPKAEIYAQKLLASGMPEGDAEKVRDIFLAREAYLLSTLAEIDRCWQDRFAFLTQGLGIPEALILSFRSQVLTGTPIL